MFNKQIDVNWIVLWINWSQIRILTLHRVIHKILRSKQRLKKRRQRKEMTILDDDIIILSRNWEKLIVWQQEDEIEISETCSIKLLN